MIAGNITVAEAMSRQANVLERAIPAIADEVRRAQAKSALDGEGPIFVGVGSSFAAPAAAVWQIRTRGIQAARLNAGEYPLPFPASRHPLIAVSQSGRSAETLAAFRSVDEAQRIAVVNVSPSPIGEAADTTITLGNLPDSYASTIGYTATVVALGMIADAWNGGVIDASWTALPAAVRKCEITLRARALDLATRLRSVPNVDYVAQASSLGSAEYGSQLLREMARIPASALSTRQYIHGPMESAGTSTHVLLGEERELDVARMLARDGNETILITTTDAPEEDHLSVIKLPALQPAQRAILEAAVMQVLAAESAAQSGLDPDTVRFHHADTKVG